MLQMITINDVKINAKQINVRMSSQVVYSDFADHFA